MNRRFVSVMRVRSRIAQKTSTDPEMEAQYRAHNLSLLSQNGITLITPGMQSQYAYAISAAEYSLEGIIYAVLSLCFVEKKILYFL
jgi:hypothetical protein